MQHVVTFEATPNPKPRALFCTCFDPRLKRAVDDLIRYLGFREGEFLLKSLGGGPLPLAHPTVTKSRCKGMVRQIRFAFEKFPSVEEYVGVMHDGCAYYTQIPEECRGSNKE